MKATARHSESPGRDNQAGRDDRDLSPEFEADPKGIKVSSTNAGANSSSVIGRRIRILVRPWPPQSCWRGTGSGSTMRPYEWGSLTQEIGRRPASTDDTVNGGNRSSIVERGCREGWCARHDWVEERGPGVSTGAILTIRQGTCLEDSMMMNNDALITV